MKMSVRAKRMQRQHKRNARQTKLSLVSLMDIFTILVFFLMLNASDVQVLQNDKSVQLPQSTADKAAKETLLVMVNQNDILLQGQKMASLEDVMQSAEDIIQPLADELTYQSQRQSILQKASGGNTESSQEEVARSITIMGDAAIPYQVLKKIMQTCAQSGYTNIALAVEHKEASTADEVAE